MRIHRHIVSALLIALLAACATPAAPPSDAPAETARGNPGASVVDPGVSAEAAARATIRLDDRHALGSRDARVILIEFADYQCTFCRSFHAGTLTAIKRAYVDTGLVRYVYKDFPLPMHAQALPASIAAYCAGLQDQYWPMQARLYQAEAPLGEALYVRLARELRLDTGRFEKCRNSLAARRAVNRDFMEARRLGLDSTPTFFLGRMNDKQITIERIVPSAPTFPELAREIDALLKR